MDYEIMLRNKQTREIQSYTVPGFNSQAEADTHAKRLAKNYFDVVSVSPVQPKRERATCHYCGMPATGFGFFNEPVCRECGG